MNSKLTKYISAIALFVGLALPASVAAQEQQAQTAQTKQAPYFFFKFNPGGNFTGPNSINSEAWLSGTSNVPGSSNEVATLWLSGATIPLGTLAGANSAVTWPNHNNHGLLAGISDTSIVDQSGELWSCFLAFFPTYSGHTCQGFEWQDNVMIPLPTLGGPNGFAAGSNNLGQIVGWAENTVHDPTCNNQLPQIFQFEAVIYGTQPGQPAIKVLSPLSPDPDGAATAINDEGQAVGISGLCSNAVGGYSAEHALLWQKDGIIVNLGSLGGQAWNTPMAINNKGDVVGFSDLSGDVSGGVLSLNAHAFLWTPQLGHMIDLGTLPGDSIGWASGINNQKQIVGRSCVDATFAACTGVLWQNNELIDLNTIIPHSPALYIVFGNDINDFGEIAGTACVVANGACNGTFYTFLAVPTGVPILAAEARSQAIAERPALPESARRQTLRQLGIFNPQPTR